MDRNKGKCSNSDIRPAVESTGLAEVTEQVGMDRIIDQIIEHVGVKELVKRIGIDNYLANLSPAQRRELKRKLQ
jgi:hypothetical protein